MITIVGVGHIFDIKKGVREIIFLRKPNIVCVELDKLRLDSLIEEKKRKNVPIAYRMLSVFQENLARKYGGRPGDEMLTAIDAAKELKVDVALIDVEASAIFGSIWQGMTFNQKIKLLVVGFFSMFIRKKQIDKELKRFEEDREEYLKYFEDEFPIIKKILIDDRDKHMANAISELSTKYKGIVAIIGDGHVDGIKKLLEPMPLEIIRLKELLSGTWGKTNNSSITISFDASK